MSLCAPALRRVSVFLARITGLIMVLSLLAPAVSMAQGSDLPDTTTVLNSLKQQCAPWIDVPYGDVRSLRYSFEVGSSKQPVEVTRNTKSTIATWRGVTLYTGLDELLAHPEECQISLQTSGPQTLILSAKRHGDFHLEAGNGVLGSYRGYFSAASETMTLVLRSDMLPVREELRGTTIDYMDWQRVSPTTWVPLDIKVVNGDMEFQMRFQWRDNMLWILDHSDYDWRGRRMGVARVKDLVLNDRAQENRMSAEEAESARKAKDIAAMLDHNKLWLDPQLRVDSLNYRFHTVREDIDETCYADKDGLIVLDVSRDGKGKLGEGADSRTIVSSDTIYRARRHGELATPQQKTDHEDRDREQFNRLRRVGLTGTQWDLPLFSYRRLLKDATITDNGEAVRDGRPCRVIEVSGIPSTRLGTGTMFGFTSWSYVHDLNPAKETLYIDTERHVPLFEVMEENRDAKRCEISFQDYVEPEPGQWVPMRIVMAIRETKPKPDTKQTSATASTGDYFTCEYNFQLVDKKQWLLKDEVSWFADGNKSRGEILEVQVNQSSPLRDEALRQIESTRQLMAPAAATTTESLKVSVYRFRLGVIIPVEAASLDQAMSESGSRPQDKKYSAIKEVLFTLNDAGNLVARCRYVGTNFFERFPVTVNAALYAEDGLMAGADSVTSSTQLMGEILSDTIVLDFGQGQALKEAKWFSINMIKGPDTGMYHGHGLWMTYINPAESEAGVTTATSHMMWDLNMALAASDPTIYRAGLERLLMLNDTVKVTDGNMRHWLRDLRHERTTVTRDALFPPDRREELLATLLELRKRVPDADARTSIALAMGWFKDPKAIPALVDSYEHSTGTERRAAAVSLGILQDRRAFDEIVAALKDDCVVVRYNAVWALAELGGPDAVAALSDALFYQKPVTKPVAGGGHTISDTYRPTREAILRAIVALGDKTFVPALKKLHEQNQGYNLDTDDLEQIEKLF